MFVQELNSSLAGFPNCSMISIPPSIAAYLVELYILKQLPLLLRQSKLSSVAQDLDTFISSIDRLMEVSILVFYLHCNNILFLSFF